eukprot:scaffold1209_cov141-Isochrysis_galbana.AAC.2
MGLLLSLVDTCPSSSPFLACRFVCETESMRPLGAVRARADEAHDRHDRKCLEGSLNMTRGHTIKHRHTAV